MKLVILLICLGLERYLHVGSLLRRFHWIRNYLALMQKLFESNAMFHGWICLAVILLPILILVGVVYLFTSHLLYGLVGIILSFVILLYCLGPDDLYHQLQKYFTAKENNLVEEEIKQYLEITGELPPAEPQLAARKLTKEIFIQANERFFAVIFWFIILGPVGALLYRLAVVFRYLSEKGEEPCALCQSQVTILQNILDWLPARLTVLLYLLVGNFHGHFKEWWTKFGTGLDTSRELLGNSGVLALTSGVLSPAGLAENQQALALVDRALIVVLVILAIFTLGQLI